MKMYILLALASAVLYGASNPMVRHAQEKGVTYNSFIIFTALAGLTIGFIRLCFVHEKLHNEPDTSSTEGLIWTFAVGAIWTIAAFTWAKALDPALGGNVSTILLIVGLNPFIAAIVSTIWFKEWEQIIPWKLGLSAVFIAAGLYFAITCKKAPATLAVGAQ